MTVNIDTARDARRLRPAGAGTPAAYREPVPTLARIEFLFDATSELRGQAQAVLRDARTLLGSELSPGARANAAGLVAHAEGILRLLHFTMAVLALGPGPSGGAGLPSDERRVP